MRCRLVALSTLALLLPLVGLGSYAFAATTVSRTVTALQSPHDTGVVLSAAETATVSASGFWRIQASGGSYGVFDANGTLSLTPYSDAAPMPNVRLGALIASVDGGSSWVLVGTGPTTVNGPGRLLLMANEQAGQFTDNFGSQSVTIVRALDDSDADGWSDGDDLCPTVLDTQADNDGDGAGDACDTDDDNDGRLDAVDAFPYTASEWQDPDGDGIGNSEIGRAHV